MVLIRKWRTVYIKFVKNVEKLIYNSPQSFLVIGSGPSDEDFDVELLQLDLILLQSPNDSFKCGCHVGKVGNTSANDKYLYQKYKLFVLSLLNFTFSIRFSTYYIEINGMIWHYQKIKS